MKFSLKQLSPIALAFAIALTILGVTAFKILGGHREAPEVRFSTLSGELVNLSDLRGKVVLVNFWATSCAPCVREIPALVQTHRKYAAQGYETIAVAMEYDPPAYVKTFSERNQVPFKVALDTRGEIAKRFNDVRVVPTTFLIDRQGRIVKSWLGEIDFSKLDGILADALKSS
jgi:peroxiredoxin